ncbi:MAG: hypothetical protein KJ879_02230 [Nanoarchaeota archaeon]|nr:hypothetical protein [Nanoarchaeota archaeon]
MGKPRTPSGKEIDTSEFFNQDNYRGRISEVKLRGSPRVYFSLDGALSDYSERNGRGHSNCLEILNLVEGGSDDNELAPVVLISEVNDPLYPVVRTECVRGVIIPVHHESGQQQFHLYEEGQFRFNL